MMLETKRLLLGFPSLKKHPLASQKALLNVFDKKWNEYSDNSVTVILGLSFLFDIRVSLHCDFNEI